MRAATRVIVLTLLACGALAASASAAEFIAATEAPVRASSGTAGEQEFHLGPFTIACAAAKGKGKVLNADELSDDVRFSHCQGTAQVGGETISSPATFKERVGFLYSADGRTVMSDFTVAIKGIECTILAGRSDNGAGAGTPSIFAESSYTEALDANSNLRLFPTGFQHELSVETETSAIEVNYEGLCQGFSSSEEGSYSGTFAVEAIHGNLEGSGEGWNKVENKEEPIVEGEGWNKVKNEIDPGGTIGS